MYSPHVHQNPKNANHFNPLLVFLSQVPLSFGKRVVLGMYFRYIEPFVAVLIVEPRRIFNKPADAAKPPGFQWQVKACNWEFPVPKM